MPYMLSKTGEVRFIRQDLVDTMRRAGWSFTTQRPERSTSDPIPRSERTPAQQTPGPGGLGRGGSGELYLGRTVVYTQPDGGAVTYRNFEAWMEGLRELGYTGVGLPDDFSQQWMLTHGFIGFTRDLDNFFAGGFKSEDKETDPNQGFLDFIEQFLNAQASGGGGGARGPTYQRPDEAAVRDGIKAFQVAVTGSLDDALLDQSTDTYMASHRKNFDNPGQEFNPIQAAQDVIRNSSTYKDIHSLRPESSDEMAWVTSQQGRLRMVGLSAEQSETLGISLARVGSSAEATESAGERAFFGATGRVAKEQRESLKRTASTVMGLL